MPDPISIISVAAVALHVARRTKEFVDGIHGAPASVRKTSQDLGAIEIPLSSLEGLLQQGRLRKQVNDVQLITMLEPPLQNCIEACENVRKVIQPYVKIAIKGHKWRSFAWTFEEKKFTELSGNLATCKQTLIMALGCANILSSVEKDQKIDSKLTRLQLHFGLDSYSVADSDFSGSSGPNTGLKTQIAGWLAETETVPDGEETKAEEESGLYSSDFATQLGSLKLDQHPIEMSSSLPKKQFLLSEDLKRVDKEPRRCQTLTDEPESPIIDETDFFANHVIQQDGEASNTDLQDHFVVNIDKVDLWVRYLQDTYSAQAPEARITIFTPEQVLKLVVAVYDRLCIQRKLQRELQRELQRQLQRMREEIKEEMAYILKFTTHALLPLPNMLRGTMCWNLLLLAPIDGKAFFYDCLKQTSTEALTSERLKLAKELTSGLARLLQIKIEFIEIPCTPQVDTEISSGLAVCLMMRTLLLDRLLKANVHDKVSASLEQVHYEFRKSGKEVEQIIKTFDRERGEVATLATLRQSMQASLQRSWT